MCSFLLSLSFFSGCVGTDSVACFTQHTEAINLAEHSRHKRPYVVKALEGAAGNNMIHLNLCALVPLLTITADVLPLPSLIRAFIGTPSFAERSVFRRPLPSQESQV